MPYVLWVCAAYTEYRQARDVLMNKLGVELDSFTVNNWTYETAIATLPAPTRGETQKVKFYLVITPNQGSDGMQLTVSRMMHYLLSLHGPDSAFRLPKAVVSTGFCAGREGKVELGDLCVATSSFNLRAGGKTRDGPVIPGTTRTEMVTDLAARAVDWEPDWQVKIERMKHDWRDPAKLINGVLQPARRNAQGQTWTPKVGCLSLSQRQALTFSLRFPCTLQGRARRLLLRRRRPEPGRRIRRSERSPSQGRRHRHGVVRLLQRCGLHLRWSGP